MIPQEADQTHTEYGFPVFLFEQSAKRETETKYSSKTS